MGAGNYLPPNSHLSYRCYYIHKASETWEEHFAREGNTYYSDPDDFYQEQSDQLYEDIVDGLKFSTFLNTAPNGMLWEHNWENRRHNTWRDNHTILLASFEYNELLLCDYDIYFAVTLIQKPDSPAKKAAAELEALDTLLLLHLAEEFRDSVYVRDTGWTSSKVNLDDHVKLAEIRRKEMARIANKIKDQNL